MSTRQLTKSAVEALPLPPRKPNGKPGQVCCWDLKLPGFGVRVGSGGARTYVVAYRATNGRQRWHKIGRHGALTADAARDRARRILLAVGDGQDPSAERKAERDQAKAEPTFSAFFEQWMQDHAERRMARSTIANVRCTFRNHVLPRLGDARISSITRADVSQLHRSLFDTPRLANQAVQQLATMFRTAIDWGLLPESHANPARCRRHGSRGSSPAIELYPEARREVALTVEQMTALELALQREEQAAGLTHRNGCGPTRPALALALRLIALTGARRSEIVKLRHDQVDLATGTIELREHKTARHGGPRRILLGPIARAVVERALELRHPTTGLPDPTFVFPGRRAGTHTSGLDKLWKKLRAAADLFYVEGDERKAIHMHDLRHTVTTAAANSGGSLAIIGKALGHRNETMTARYAHLANDPVRQEAGRMAELISDAWGMRIEPAKVVPLRMQGGW